MSVKEKTRKELENRVSKLEQLIARKGIGSEYLHRAEKVQRDLNLAVFIGTATIIGISAYLAFRKRD